MWQRLVSLRRLDRHGRMLRRELLEQSRFHSRKEDRVCNNNSFFCNSNNNNCLVGMYQTLWVTTTTLWQSPTTTTTTRHHPGIGVVVAYPRNSCCGRAWDKAVGIYLHYWVTLVTFIEIRGVVTIQDSFFGRIIIIMREETCPHYSHSNIHNCL